MVGDIKKRWHIKWIRRYVYTDEHIYVVGNQQPILWPSSVTENTYLVEQPLKFSAMLTQNN